MLLSVQQMEVGVLASGYTGKTISVASAAQLVAAVKTARGGDTIVLASGNYGDVGLGNLRADGLVTIKSADPANEAVFKTLRLTNMSNILVQDVEINNVIAPGGVKNSGMAICKSSNITFQGLNVHGSLNNNALDDAHGIVITGSDHVAILDSSFRQLNAAIAAGNSSDVIVAGNTITEAREGVNLVKITGGLFERNYVTNMQAAPTDHSDAFQVGDGNGLGASSDLEFRNNIMVQGSGTTFQGVFVREEHVAEGLRHSNIAIENNYYTSASRNGLSVANVDGLVISGNTVTYTGSGGLVPAIMAQDVHGGSITNNIAPLLLDVKNTGSTGLTWKNNIDLWDPQFKVGVAQASVLQAQDAGAIDFSKLGVIAGSVAAVAGAGFHVVDQIGNLGGSAASQMASYLPQFDHHFATLFHA